MSRSRRLLTAALVAVVPLAGTPALSPPADAVTGPTLEVHGSLLVVPSEVPGGSPMYGVALAGGGIVPVRGRFPDDVRTGATFDGRVTLPEGLLATLEQRGESGPAAALRLAGQRTQPLVVLGTPSVSAPPQADVTPTVHQQFVAAIDNKGTLQSDTQLLAHVTAVGSYWEGESNGAITGITVPATVTHYGTSLPTTDCGLGSDFYNVIQEAAAQFPGHDFVHGGSDQLVVFVPDSCASGGVVGEGTVGSSFESGGALIVKATDSIEGIYAHETGHNYGFQHSNVRTDGSSLEYYGIYDVMGFALPAPYNQLTALSTPFRVFQGIADPGEIQDVAPGTGSTPVHVTATIKPRSDAVGLRSVRVQDPDTGEHLYLDYRAGTGQDTGSAYAAGGSLGAFGYAPGVTVDAARGGGGVDTLVVDQADDTSLGSGASWSNTSGDLTVTVTSIGVSGATVAVDYTPAITPAPAPSINGTPRVDRALSVVTGSWMAGVTLGYQWYVGGSAVAGATGTSYSPRARDIGKTVRAAVTGTKTGFPSVTRTSAPTAAVAPGVLAASRPTITGKAKVGRTLVAHHGTWSPRTTFSYAWYASGKRIKHRTGATLTLAKAQRGKRITVRVTGKKPGYTTVSKTAATTARVR
jgi:hypothetical protein